MDTGRFPALLAALTTVPSRRAVLKVLGGFGLAGFLSPAAARKRKRKNKKHQLTLCVNGKSFTVPRPDASLLLSQGAMSGACSPPSPPPFCAGKNHCMSNALCQASGVNCECWLRADDGHIGEPFCGLAASPIGKCGGCSSGTVCVLFVGNCGEGFGCSGGPCPQPR
jgi:hypothetical protein